MRQQYRWGWYQLVMPHRTTRTPCNMCSVRTHALSDKRSVSHAHTHVSLLHGREKGEGRARRVLRMLVLRVLCALERRRCLRACCVLGECGGGVRGRCAGAVCGGCVQGLCAGAMHGDGGP